jgi:hypothetical protein
MHGRESGLTVSAMRATVALSVPASRTIFRMPVSAASTARTVASRSAERLASRGLAAPRALPIPARCVSPEGAIELRQSCHKPLNRSLASSV